MSLYGETRAGVLNILIMVPLLLLFGEVTPKTIAVGNPVRVNTAVAEGVMMSILDMDGHRIAKLRVSTGEIETAKESSENHNAASAG